MLTENGRNFLEFHNCNFEKRKKNSSLPFILYWDKKEGTKRERRWGEEKLEEIIVTLDLSVAVTVTIP